MRSEMLRRPPSSFLPHGWPVGGSVLILAGVSALAAPARLEGPELLPIGPGHALSVLDTLALVPLLAGVAWIYVGLWRRRGRVLAAVRSRPGVGVAAAFVGGSGMGLLVASSFSSFFWWWAVGAVVFSAVLVLAVVVARAGRDGIPR